MIYLAIDKLAKRLAPAPVIALCAAAIITTTDAQAGSIDVLFTEQENDVLVSFSGSLDVSDFGQVTNTSLYNGTAVGAGFSTLTITPSASVGTAQYFLSGEPFQNFGSGSFSFGIFNGGDLFGFVDNGNQTDQLYLPYGYVSGTPISGSGTFTGSFASLGIDPTAVSVFLPGEQEIHLTFEPYSAVSEVPLPAALSLFMSALGVGGFVARRRRRD